MVVRVDRGRYDEHFSKEISKEVAKDAISDVGQ